jgi:hypothetical protein
MTRPTKEDSLGFADHTLDVYRRLFDFCRYKQASRQNKVWIGLAITILEVESLKVDCRRRYRYLS